MSRKLEQDGSEGRPTWTSLLDKAADGAIDGRMQAWLDRELSQDDRRRLLADADASAQLNRRLASWHRLKRMIRDDGRRQRNAAPDLCGSILGAVHQGRPFVPARARRKVAVARGAIAAALVGAFTAGLVWIERHGGESANGAAKTGSMLSQRTAPQFEPAEGERPLASVATGIGAGQESRERPTKSRPLGRVSGPVVVRTDPEVDARAGWVAALGGSGGVRVEAPESTVARAQADRPEQLLDAIDRAILGRSAACAACPEEGAAEAMAIARSLDQHGPSLWTDERTEMALRGTLHAWLEGGATPRPDVAGRAFMHE